MALNIGELVGFVKLDTSGVDRGVRSTRTSMTRLGSDMDSTGRKGSRLGGMIAMGAKTGGLALVAAGALGVKSAVSLEAQFSKTMNVLKATTGASAKEMQGLSDLAMKMGADTVFSAADASQAMLELARGGISPANIQAGALKGTLTLAAAGEMDMATSANIAVKAMGQFNLKGKEMDSVAAALAGGANASSASVQDMAFALAQGGLAANSVGFSLQETTAALAAFSNSGLEGSDAGTSLKTMLDHLIPASEKAENVFERLGLQTKAGNNAFVKANGEYESMAMISERLKRATEGLTAAERKKAITTMFGSDAQRAATIFAAEGEDGMNKFIKATSDTSAAQKMAAANMKGTSGAIEALKGSVETLTLKFGLMIAPALQTGLKWLTDLTNRAADALSGGGKGTGWIKSVANWVREDLVPAFKKLAADVLPEVKRTMGDAKKGFSDAKPFFALVGDLITQVLIPNIGKLSKTVLPLMGQHLRTIGWVLGEVGKSGRNMWNQMLQPVFKFMTSALARTLLLWGRMFQVIGKVPGFGWVGDIGDRLVHTANNANELSNNIKDIPKFWNTKITADTSQARAGIAGVNTALHNLTNNAWTAVVKASKVGQNAKGTDNWRGGMTWVGEEGPELINLPRGSAVHSAKESMAMARAARQGIKAGAKSAGTSGKEAAAAIAKAMREKMREREKDVREGARDLAQRAIDGVKDKIAGAKQALASVRDAMASIASTVKDAFSPDLFGQSTAAGFLAAGQASIKQMDAMLAARKKLSKMGGSADFLTQLFSSGNSALIAELAGGGRKQLLAAQQTYAYTSHQGSKLGRQVGQAQLGGKVDKVTAELRELRKDMRELERRRHRMAGITVHQRRGESANELAERLWFKTRTRG